MKGNGERSVKSVNMKWLVLLAVADVLVVLFFVAPELVKGASLTQVSERHTMVVGGNCLCDWVLSAD